MKSTRFYNNNVDKLLFAASALIAMGCDFSPPVIKRPKQLSLDLNDGPSKFDEERIEKARQKRERKALKRI